VGRLIGRHGSSIEALRRATGANIRVGAHGVVRISAGEMATVERACREVRASFPAGLGEPGEGPGSVSRALWRPRGPRQAA
jgi:polyribonucleotide nucleotidyltransferase